MTFDVWVRDTGERAVSTFIQSVGVFLTAGPALDATWVQALAAACLPPILAVLMNALPQLRWAGGPWWQDALVRVVRSFVQGFLAALIANATNIVSLGAVRAAAIGGGLAVLTVVKTLIARQVPNTLTPASLTT
jgi:Putative lactococcus lactis phage r1t holin